MSLVCYTPIAMEENPALIVHNALDVVGETRALLPA
jgi:hypothetical protein